MSSRVCDTCIRKKAKCNQARPICSRCFERKEVCTYSAKRRKPGPQPGFTRPSLSSRSQANSGRQRGHDGPHVVTEALSPTPAASPAEYLILDEIPNQGHPEAVLGTRSSNLEHIDPNPIDSTQEEHLLERYFDIAQDASPIFSKVRFLHSYRNSVCDQSLVSTITAITAKLTSPVSSVDSAAIDARIDLLLSSTAVHDDLFTDFPSLDQFRKSCVLAFYEFHQFPGHQSWTRMGNLTRVACRAGLDRLENLRTRHPEWRILGEEDMEEWRAVWWCIYRLDSYATLSSGTPSLIDPSLINTALILRNPAQSLIIEGALPQIFLSAEFENLWKLLPSVIAHPETLVSSIHNITITLMQQAAHLTRVCPLRPQDEAIELIANVERQLSALRLALPPGWLNPKRNAFSYESHTDHHTRLVTVLHLLMSQLLLSILHCVMQGDEAWLMSWQQVIEACQNIASIAEQWDSFFCVKVDPAIAFIAFTALIFLDLHKKSTAISTVTVHSQIDHDKTVLHLQLEHFAKVWTLPRLLKLSFATFSEATPGPLTFRQIKHILSRFEAPLHLRWLQFLSTPQTYLGDCEDL